MYVAGTGPMKDKPTSELLSQIRRPSLTGLFTSLRFLLVAPAALLASTAFAQDAERWFQIELSVFTNESSVDRNEEQWDPNPELAYPANTRRLDRLSDLLLIDSLIDEPSVTTAETDDVDRFADVAEPDIESLRRSAIFNTGPFAKNPETDFRFFDFERDAFLQLAPSESDFRQTNRALERSAEHRLLFHAIWRQPLPNVGDAIPLYVEGGSVYGDQHELQGTVSLHFNRNRDRVVVDTNLWLAEFSAVETDQEWTLPAIPEQLSTRPIEPDGQTADVSTELNYTIRRIFEFSQSRPMRSTEFHYLDHPALGMVITVIPYAVPELPLPESRFR